MDAAQTALSVHFSNACNTIAAVGKSLHITAFTPAEIDALEHEIGSAAFALADVQKLINAWKGACPAAPEADSARRLRTFPVSHSQIP